VEFDALVPPRVTKDKPYATNEVSMSYYCRFAQMLLFLPPIDDIEYDFDLGVEFGSGLSNGVHYKLVLYMNRAIWRYLMMKKDLHPELLR